MSNSNDNDDDNDDIIIMIKKGGKNLPILDTPQEHVCNSCNLKNKFDFSACPTIEYASCIARKKGDDLKIP